MGQWLTQREEFDKGIQALNAFVERAGLFTDDEHFGSL
nr:type II toxin-antitoxin system CcdA family antitoxin [Pantoea dispersa]